MPAGRKPATPADQDSMEYNRNQYGERIRRYRQAKGLNQPQLAKLLDTTKNTISNWESGRARPDINMLPQLCEIFSITISQFFGGRSYEDLTSEERRHMENYRKLSAANRRITDSLVQSMLNVQSWEDVRRRAETIRQLRHSADKAAAGTGNPLTDYRSAEYIYVHEDRLTRDADEIITVTGNSMEPTFHEGDDLLVQYTDSVHEGEIGIFVANGDGYVKEYRKDGLHSHNPAYATLHFTEDDHVRCIGRVLGVLQSDGLATEEEIEAYRELQVEHEH